MLRTAPVLIFAAVLCAAQTVNQPVRAVTDPGVITTRQAITPAGVPSIFQGRVYGVSWAGQSGNLWVLHASQIYRLDWNNNRVLSQVPHGGTPGNQSLFTDPVTGDAFVGASLREPPATANTAALFVAREDKLRPLAKSLGRFQPGALSLAAEPNASGKRYAVGPLVWENKLAVPTPAVAMSIPLSTRTRACSKPSS